MIKRPVITSMTARIWSCATLDSGSGKMVDMGDDFNDINVCACSSDRHDACKAKGECDRCSPDDTFWKRLFLGLDGNGSMTAKLDKRLHRKLHRIFKECKEYFLTVKK
jgi:hypothetical protein